MPTRKPGTHRPSKPTQKPSNRRATVDIADRTLTLTNLDKVLYPASGMTKREVIDYFEQIAPWMIPHVRDRALTRKRWADGVDGPVFFEKNLPQSAPDWIARRTIEHREHDNTYPIADDVATMVWLAQQAALELHTPQWRFGPRGGIQHPDRLVLDLDPGDGVGLRECAEVARAAREILRGMDLDPYPVTSGSKGIHLYAALDGRSTTDRVSAVAHELAKALEQDMPDLVLSSMSRAQRAGKVFVDWSQNNGNKTTIAPYSLRGKEQPWVAAPRTWDELDDRRLAQLPYTEVLARVAAHGDLLHPVAAASLSVGRPDHGHWDPATPAQARSGGTAPDRLATYRSKRDASKTPEPVPVPVPVPSETPERTETPAGTDGEPTFVIQEHHATRDHYDFRLERDGVLVSWALPKGEPTEPGTNHLAVQTEDHPLEYGSFEGTIPQGEYGGGTVTIWDNGTYECEKWRAGEEVIVTLHGRTRGARRLALLHTRGRGGAGDEKNWLIHFTKEQPGSADGRPESRPDVGDRPAASRPFSERTPMLAALPKGSGALDPADWAFEMKWDGIRALASVRDGRVTLRSRNGNDLTAQYPELGVLADRVAVDAVLDGEIVAEDDRGRPDFGLLQQRMGMTHAREVAAAMAATPVRYLVFDVLEADGHELTRLAYDHRREALATILSSNPDSDGDAVVAVPAAFSGSLDEAMAASKQRGLEGVVAKRRSSRYAEGRRSESWLKLKHHATQEVVVGGWRPGSGRRAGGLGSLLLGIPSDDGLVYVGRVGTGFRDRDLDEILAALEPLARKTSPFVDVPRPDARDAHWVTPKLVGEVEFAEWTSTGRLRQPSWRGWRPDKPATEVTRES